MKTEKESEMAKTKGELLEHYAGKPVTAFYQYDGFVIAGRGDDVMRPDRDGDCLMGGTTHELMSGGPAVRILVTRGTSRKDAVRLLKKLRRWIKQGGFRWQEDQLALEWIKGDEIPF